LQLVLRYWLAPPERRGRAVLCVDDGGIEVDKLRTMCACVCVRIVRPYWPEPTAGDQRCEIVQLHTHRSILRYCGHGLDPGGPAV